MTRPASTRRGKLAAAGHLGGLRCSGSARARLEPGRPIRLISSQSGAAQHCVAAPAWPQWPRRPPRLASPPTMWGGGPGSQAPPPGWEVGWSGQPRCWVQWVVGRGAGVQPPPLLRPALLCSAGNFHIINSAAQFQAAAPSHSQTRAEQPDIARCLTCTDSGDSQQPAMNEFQPQDVKFH